MRPLCTTVSTWAIVIPIILVSVSAFMSLRAAFALCMFAFCLESIYRVILNKIPFLLFKDEGQSEYEHKETSSDTSESSTSRVSFNLQEPQGAGLDMFVASIKKRIGKEKDSDQSIDDTNCREKLRRASTYYEWFEAACAIEEPKAWSRKRKSHHDWKRYDKVLLRDRRNALKEARQSNDIHYLKETLRGELVRNIGHVTKSRVFENKVLPPYTIEKYIKEVVKSLKDTMNYEGNDFTIDEKMKYITEIYYSYGSTALLLSGGGSLGAFHLGVLRALIDQDCLPHIIAGSSGGSVIAALAGSRSLKDLQYFLSSDQLKTMKMWFKFSSIYDAAKHYRSHGHLQDVEYFVKWLQNLYGDLTFLEAKEVSGKTLNIVVTPAHTNEPPRVLNYINAPNVLIWSAVSASCAFPLLFPAQDLRVKLKDKTNAPFATIKSVRRTKSGRWHDGTLGEDLPTEKLKEHFHVSYAIVSQTNIHAAPWLTVKRYLPQALAFLIESEFKHRIRQLEALIPSRRLSNLLKMFHMSWEGDTTVVLPMNPASGFRSVLMAVTSLERKDFLDLVEKGERATWPKIQGIKCMTAIEQEIAASLNKIHSQLSIEHDQRPWATLN